MLDLVVQQALEQAWNASLAGDPIQRHEEGGWIYMDHTTGMVAVRRAPAGAQASLDLSTPPVVPRAVVVATFHTHPNPSADAGDKTMGNSVVGLAADQVLAIAQADAARVYRDLSVYQIQLVLEDDGWHIDYELKNPRLKGGGPHYIIDAHTGTVISKRYEQ